MGKQNNIITREILILTMRFMEQKVILFRYRTDVRDEPARPQSARPCPNQPWRSLTAYFSNVLKDTNLKLSHNIATGLELFVFNFHRDFIVSSEVIVFFAKTNFYIYFLRITQEPLNISKIWLSHVKERLKTCQNHSKFYFKNKFYKVQNWLFTSNRPVLTLFFF